MSVLGLSCAVVTEDIKCLKVQLSFHIGSLIGLLCFFTFRSSDNWRSFSNPKSRDERYAEPPNHQWSKFVFQVGCLHLRYFETGTIRPRSGVFYYCLGLSIHLQDEIVHLLVGFFLCTCVHVSWLDAAHWPQRCGFFVAQAFALGLGHCEHRKHAHFLLALLSSVLFLAARNS